MTNFSRPYVAFIVVLAALGLAACGGAPSGPSSPSDVVLHGVIQGGSAGGATAYSGAGGVPIVVTVQGTPITTTVAEDGSFTLRGLPTGSFVLVFTQGGVPLGTATFAEVMPNQEITITIQVTPSGWSWSTRSARASATATPRSKARWSRSSS